ncbi:hypothetical protein [Amniculibacterium sp. G2-70]|uniref:hypothetical protein n=1 Tax=Amniculibacterium sp. G2-70 TaxID=2767188 RepID=UPI001654AFE5|nr:hypothetical protein [Amniculibacterium sp. G2-70]
MSGFCIFEKKIMGIFKSINKKWNQFLDNRIEKMSIALEKQEQKTKQSVTQSINVNEKTGLNLVNQVLETLHILQSTKKQETYFSRFNFLEKKAEQLDELSNHYNWSKIVEVGVENYKNLYPDRGNSVQNAQYLKEKYLNMIDILEDTLPLMVERYLQSEKIEIENLKTAKAKENRRVKMSENFQKILKFVNEQGYANDDDFYLEIIDLKEV